MPARIFSTLFLFMLFSVSLTQAQAWLDIAGVMHTTFRHSGMRNDKTNARADGNWLQTVINVPVKLDSLNLLLVSPGFEYRSVTGDTLLTDAYYRTAYLPITWVHNFSDSKYRLSLTGIYRFNADTRNDFNADNDQVGVAAIVSRKQSRKITYKAGLYFNQEFFNNQWIPFLGIDAHITHRLYVTSLLPRYLILDYTLAPAFHCGLWFRGIDESYRLRYRESSKNSSDYFRATEGYLRLYADYYIPKTMIVVTLAAGHTLQRKYNYEVKGFELKTFPEPAFMLQAGVALRFVTDDSFRTKPVP